MEVFLKQRQLFGIRGTDLSFSESSKNWLDYAQALEYVKNMAGRLPTIEELALLRVATFHSKEEYNNVWHEAWKYQATNTFAFFWKQNDAFFMYIESGTSQVSNYAMRNINDGITAHAQNNPWLVEKSGLELDIEDHRIQKSDNAVDQIRVDSLANNSITSTALRSAAAEYATLLKDMCVDYFHIQTPSNEQLRGILQNPNEIAIYSVGLGGDDSGINELICNQILTFRNKATAVMMLDNSESR
jgi:hypothetical protein